MGDRPRCAKTLREFDRLRDIGPDVSGKRPF
jgi:hypothetical protein